MLGGLRLGVESIGSGVLAVENWPLVEGRRAQLEGPDDEQYHA